MKCRIAVLCIVLFAPVTLLAQLEALRARNDKAVLLKSKVMAEDRTLWIHLPPGYSKDNTYPVLYLLDGEGHFGYGAEAVDYLSAYDRNRIPEVIVVAVVNIDRGRDFTPVYTTKENTAVDSTAGAGRFLRYLVQEVIPYIDTHYSVQPYRILAGHSLGGLFALYAKEAVPNVFPAVILTSPAIRGTTDPTLDAVSDMFTPKHPYNGKLYITLGDENTQTVDSLTSRLKHKAPTWFTWTYRKYDDENHFSVTYKSLFDGLKFIYKNWFLDYYGNAPRSNADIFRHFANLSTEFGYPLVPREDFLNNCGYNQLRAGHIANAIEIFLENVRRHPDSANAYDSLGEAYMKAGNKTLAIRNYRRSLELDPHNEEGREVLKRLEGKRK